MTQKIGSNHSQKRKNRIESPLFSPHSHNVNKQTNIMYSKLISYIILYAWLFRDKTVLMLLFSTVIGR